jgi:hypothetical protein
MNIGLGIFQVLVDFLFGVGAYGFLFPWILVFAIMYAMLLKTKVLGEKGAVIGIVALVVAFIVPVLAPYGVPMGSILTVLFGYTGAIIAFLVAAMLVLAMIGYKIK